MEKYRDILFSVWREMCRHIDIADSTRTVAPVLAERLPLAALVIRRIDRQHSSLETVAAAGAGRELAPQIGRTSVSQARLKRLISWADAGQLLHGQRIKRSGELALIVPEELEGEVLVGPLRNADGPAGVLALIATHARSFKDEHLRIAEQLLEPFSVALENDHRLHELTTLRSTAEADGDSSKIERPFSAALR